jgi:hypothetical protein
MFIPAQAEWVSENVFAFRHGRSTQRFLFSRRGAFFG